jgi:adenylate kinase
LGKHLDFVVNLDVPKDVILERLSTRRTCSNADCQAIYNIKSIPPNPDGSCKKCGAPTIQRADETIAAINNRLDVYNEKTAPLIGFYEKLGMLNNVPSLNSQDTAAAIVKSLSGQACVGCCCGGSQK